ncbi:MAG: NTP transferase domain-containing protein [Phycisphaerae bacterium]
MEAPHDIACVILAGGQGKRMRSADLHKVCFPILGRPAIVRAIDTYKAAGLRRFLVVVGQMAEQVIGTISAAHPEVTFVYQARPLGTGHAAAVAAKALALQGDCLAAMVTMGDKVTRPNVVRQLLDHFQWNLPDVVLATVPKEPDSPSGRVVVDRGGKVLGIVEAADVERARRTRTPIRLAGTALSAGRIEKLSATVNPSLYLFRFDSLAEALAKLRPDNVQGERYLTDAIEVLASSGARVEAMPLADPTDIMGFNTPGELMAIERVLRQREKPPRVSAARRRALSGRVLRTAGQWRRVVESDSPAWRRVLRRTYGADEALLAERRKTMSRLVQAFIRRHGPQRKMILCRAPGRVNLMGRHVDHRGGHVNVMAFGREVLLAAAKRDDDVICLTHVQPRRFGARQFRVSDLLREASWADWIDFVDSQAVRGLLAEAGGDWSHYARAAVLRLQHECRDIPLCGMDCTVTGNIPMGAGLSSSSALVVAFAEAAVALNGLHVAPRDFVDLCGEGEWFVGSRGGSADHAAIRTARIGHLRRIGFFPFRLEGEVRFPRELQVVLAHSGSQAVKSKGARDTFNQRVASYQLAELLLRKRWPAAAGMEHLRDLTPEKLKVRPGDIYRALKLLPDRPSRRALRKLFTGEDRDRVERIFSSHANLGPYDLRGVTMYGLAEIVRSERFAKELSSGDLDRLRRLIQISHNGDRLVKWAPDGRRRRFTVRTDDATLDRLAAADADLACQCGRYACSTEAVDQLVDVAEATEGVVGAQLAGAGLGGCMMIIVRATALERLMRRLRTEFYGPRRLAFGAFVCSPVAGAGLLGV